MIVGNITTTTIGGLETNTEYDVKISGIVEDQSNPVWKALDSYGRRAILEEGLVGNSISGTVHTLAYEFQFEYFNANMTQNHGPVSNQSVLGPTGLNSSEGHYGLHFVGDASVENCNASSICCDVFDVDGNCDDTTLVCGPSFLQKIMEQQNTTWIPLFFFFKTPKVIEKKIAQLKCFKGIYYFLFSPPK